MKKLEQNGCPWNKAQIDEIKREIRFELDTRAPSTPKGKRIEYAMQRLADLQDEPSAENDLRRYVLAMSALVEHSRYSGLTQADVKQLTQLAEAILKVNKVPTTNSRYAFLYADLYLLLSQVNRLEGNLTEALWEKQIANTLSTKATPDRVSFQMLSNGIHLLRMGYAPLALGEFRVLAFSELDPSSQVRWALEHHMALRLSLQLEEALAFSTEFEKLLKAAPPEQKQEWEWEKLCRECQATGDIDSVMRRALPKKDFAIPPYSIEAYFLSRTVQEKSWMERFSLLKQKQKPRGPSIGRYEIFWSVATVLDDAYNHDLDYVLRLRALGNVISRMSELRSIYHELLVRAAVVRWLVRRPTHILAKVCISEYQELSSRLSAAKSNDVLGLLPDVAVSSPVVEEEAA